MITFNKATWISAANNNATLVKSGETKLGYIIAGNSNAAARYIKFFDLSSVPASDDVPSMTIRIPPTDAGAVTIDFPTGGVQFKTGLGFKMVTGAGTLDDTAVALNDVQLTIGYQ